MTAYAVALFDGELIDPAALRLDQFSSGFFFGCGLFETLALEGDRPQFLGRHLARLRRGLAALPVVRGPPDDAWLEPAAFAEPLAAALARCAERHGARPDVMKLTVADGHALVTFRDAPPERARWQREGVTVDALAPGGYRAGDPLRNHKTLSYLRQYAAMADNPLFANERGEVCEAPTSNVFVALDDRVVTPVTSAPCLPGVIREILLEAGELGGLPVVAEPLPGEALARARGCFLTNSVSLALPVRRLLGRPLEPSVELAALARAALTRAG